MRVLAFVGNKRSGTSLLVRMLNQHPDIYVSHESGILWLLNHLSKGGTSFPSYKRDLDPNSIKHTWKYYGKLINPALPPHVNYLTVQIALMMHGTPWLGPMRKDPRIVGDKIPNRQLDIMSWTTENFEDVVFLHCVRHPLDWAESAKRFRHKLRYGGNRAEMLKTWVEYENRVRTCGYEVTTVRYEDLCEYPQNTMSWVYESVGVDPIKVDAKKVKLKAYKKRKGKVTSDVAELMERYGYE